MNFRRSITIAGLWRPKVARQILKRNFYALFGKTTPCGKRFKILFLKFFIATRINVLCSNYVKFGDWKSVKSCVAYLTKKISPGSSAVATARIAPKICPGQPPTMYSSVPHLIQIGYFRRSYSRTRERRKVNPIFG